MNNKPAVFPTSRFPPRTNGERPNYSSHQVARAVGDAEANPRTVPTICKRTGELVPLWKQANAALAALPDPQPPLVRTIAGEAWTVAKLETLCATGYDHLVKLLNEKQEALDETREALREHDAVVDRLNKNWYVKNTYDPGTDIYDALAGIPVEASTPAPDPIGNDTVTQGGERGLQVLVSYVAGGGDHATTR